MNSSEMLRLIDSIARDRNIDKELLLTDLEQALASAARKHYNADEEADIVAEIDRLNGKISMWFEGEPIDLEELGRIPAQTAKQVMIQRFREDERDAIYREFIDRVGELITGTAQRYEGGALVVSLGSRAEGFMPRSEQIQGEQHQPGERVRCLILDVREAGNQVKIALSRASPDLIRRLFEIEVPEVAERIIEIKAMAREAGHRTKIAVASIDSKVDAVGACVGVRGSRIRNIVDELGGEKIDIVRWNESSQILIQNALKPAEIVEISLCFELGRATVVVNEDQLSLAIGKRGQNVRLAARLSNWDIDILTPAEFTKGLDTLDDCLKGVEGVEQEMVDRLAALGVISVFDVEEVGIPYLTETLLIDQETAERMTAAASERSKVVAEEQAKEKEEKERVKREEAAGIVSMPGAAQAAAILGDILPPAPAEGETSSDAAAEPSDTGDAEDAGGTESSDAEAETEATETEATEAVAEAPAAEDASAEGEPAADTAESTEEEVEEPRPA
ncbi:MAG: transcription termination factor NusA [Planctomycetota bacterium]